MSYYSFRKSVYLDLIRGIITTPGRGNKQMYYNSNYKLLGYYYTFTTLSAKFDNKKNYIVSRNGDEDYEIPLSDSQLIIKIKNTTDLSLKEKMIKSLENKANKRFQFSQFLKEKSKKIIFENWYNNTYKNEQKRNDRYYVLRKASEILPSELFKKIVKWPIVSKSPYSDSFYNSNNID